MILTYKFKHDMSNIDGLLEKAQLVANHAIEFRTRSSKDVRHIGLPSAISNQILKKYACNRKCKKATNVVLGVPGQGCKLFENSLSIPCLKYSCIVDFRGREVTKINQVEVSKHFLFVSVTVQEAPLLTCYDAIGVDRNTTGHAIVAASTSNGKVLKLGKQACHLRRKYRNTREKLRNSGKFRALRKLGSKEQKHLRDLDHKMSKTVVSFAIDSGASIVLEDLKGIREGTKRKSNRRTRWMTNAWSFSQFESFLTYKAQLAGVPIHKVDPKYTSQQCARCGKLGTRKDKSFVCSCGHIEHADVNAAFVIAARHIGVRSLEECDSSEGQLTCPRKQCPPRG